MFEILPIGSVSFAPTNGAHARSWARIENGQLTLFAFRPPISGEEKPLDYANEMDPRVKDAVRSTRPVVVAAFGSQSIAQCNHLGVVVYGEGEIDIRREQGERAEIASHYFGGAVTMAKATIANQRLKFTTYERNSAGKPLEWVEVSIS